MLLCMAYLRRTSQVAALAYSNFFFGKAGIIKLFLKFQLKSTRHSFFSLRLWSLYTVFTVFISFCWLNKFKTSSAF